MATTDSKSEAGSGRSIATDLSQSQSSSQQQSKNAINYDGFNFADPAQAAKAYLELQTKFKEQAGELEKRRKEEDAVRALKSKAAEQAEAQYTANLSNYFPEIKAMMSEQLGPYQDYLKNAPPSVQDARHTLSSVLVKSSETFGQLAVKADDLQTKYKALEEEHAKVLKERDVYKTISEQQQRKLPVSETMADRFVDANTTDAVKRTQSTVSSKAPLIGELSFEEFVSKKRKEAAESQVAPKTPAPAVGTSVATAQKNQMTLEEMSEFIRNLQNHQQQTQTVEVKASASNQSRDDMHPIDVFGTPDGIKYLQNLALRK